MEYINEKLNEFNDYIRFRKVAIIGLGVSNLPLMKYLYEKKANVTIFDERDIDSISKDIMDKITTYGFSFHFGEEALKNLKGFNVIFRSPSCLPTRKELINEANNGAIITTEVELLMKMCPCKIVGVTGSDGKTTTTSLINAILKKAGYNTFLGGNIGTPLFTKLPDMRPEVGVTGSDGKTTTTSLINAILKKAGYNTFLGGNIGTPLFTKLPDMRPEDILVLELSSFQLMGMEISPDIAVITNITPNHLNIHKDYEEYIEAKKNIFPDIAVITNITPNHLNIHKDYEEYIEAKKNIFKYQDEKGVLVLNYDNEITRNCEKEANGKVIFFSSKNKLDNGYIVDEDVIKECEDKIRKHILNVEDVILRGNHNYQNIATASKNKLDNGYIVDEDVIKECEDKIRKHILNVEDVILRGNHNYQNIATAIAATSSLVDMDIAVDAIKEFKPVEHRIEFIRELDGVKWYNDSASSSPSRTLSGINAFKEDIILIAGGYDKNLDYTPLAKPIIKKVKSLILIGQTSGKIFDVVKLELEKENKELDIHMCETLEETVNLAKKVVKPGQVVLFSPASASFDMFKNFADRGNQFKELVKKIN